jgi:acetylxylan esterase
MLAKASTALLLASAIAASPLDLDLPKRQSCPPIHVFGARETTASPGYGSSYTVVQLVLQSYSGSTSEAISYPACGGQSSCGGASYASSVNQGISAIASAVNNFNSQCPNSIIVIVGYSQVSCLWIGVKSHFGWIGWPEAQGAQITDDALCGGPDNSQGYGNSSPAFSSSAINKIAAAILMGDPRNIAGLSYNVGTCSAYGVSAQSFNGAWENRN